MMWSVCDSESASSNIAACTHILYCLVLQYYVCYDNKINVCCCRCKDIFGYAGKKGKQHDDPMLLYSGFWSKVSRTNPITNTPVKQSVQL